jgi:hypothetical protein
LPLLCKSPFFIYVLRLKIVVNQMRGAGICAPPSIKTRKKRDA